jgi:6-phosphogluconolactonase
VTIDVFPNVAETAAAAARAVAAAAREAVAARGRFVFAVSGGKSPWEMMRVLAGEDVPWKHVEIVQVDERIAPLGDPSRNLTHLRASLLERAPLSPDQIHPMPVEDPDLAAGARTYAAELTALCGDPPTIDLVHLGLGPDGHTASLVPGDPVLAVTNADVAVTQPYQGRRRMTLTYPVLERARHILWLVIGADKPAMLVRLRDRDPSIPAGRVAQDHAVAYADAAAGVLLGR